MQAISELCDPDTLDRLIERTKEIQRATGEDHNSPAALDNEWRGPRITEAISGAGLTPESVADEIGIPASEVRLYTKGLSAPDDSLVYMLAVVTGYPTRYLSDPGYRLPLGFCPGHRFVDSSSMDDMQEEYGQDVLSD
jgi:hypothetical protein